MRMKLATRFICAAVVVACATTVTWGQPPVRGRDGFSGPFGQPGGMQQSLVMLLGAQEVRTELDIRDEQQKQIDDLEKEQELKVFLEDLFWHICDLFCWKVCKFFKMYFITR